MKIHMATGGLGRPVRFILTGGHTHDCTQALALMADFKFSHVLADKGYDSDTLLETIESQGAIPIIPPKANRKIQREYDKTLYKHRNLIERTFNKLKHHRRLAIRYVRKSQHFPALLYLAALTLWVS
jgi:transposase